MIEKAKTQPAEAQPRDKAKVSDRVMSATPVSAATRGPAVTAPKDDLQQRIKQRAHDIWEREGHPKGREQAHWQQAEREIRGSSTSGLARVAGTSTSATAARPASGAPSRS